ncbi:hypothetical protein M8818_004856 [Zalaria obscura]|uniref:Uncharacterized protein n=1 Tax=Zalaria obscura TaxID=2024903 RepID=A0ACC3SAR4_9PEZI
MRDSVAGSSYTAPLSTFSVLTHPMITISEPATSFQFSYSGTKTLTDQRMDVGLHTTPERSEISWLFYEEDFICRELQAFSISMVIDEWQARNHRDVIINTSIIMKDCIGPTKARKSHC